MPLTSIIIPTHDRPLLLPRAVESAKRAGANIEVVIVDDASVDDTRAVCAAMQDVVYVRTAQRGGVGAARAAGLAASSGTYIAFLDDDDARLPGSVDRQVAVLESFPGAALVYGQVYLASQALEFDEQNRFPLSCPSGDLFLELVASNFIASCSAVVRRSAVDAVGGYYPEAMPADDWDLWLRISERYPVACLPEPVAIYRKPTLWSGQGLSRLADGVLAANQHVLDRCAQLPRATSDPRAYHRVARRTIGVLCLRLLAQGLEAARRRDVYAFVSFRKGLARPAALARAIFSRYTWRKIRERFSA